MKIKITQADSRVKISGVTIGRIVVVDGVAVVVYDRQDDGIIRVMQVGEEQRVMHLQPSTLVHIPKTINMEIEI